MFLGINSHTNLNQNALVDSYGDAITYQELIDFSNLKLKSIVKEKSLLFIISNNQVGAAAMYYACLFNKIVPLILGSDISIQQLLDLKDKYQPNYIVYPQQQKNKWSSVLEHTISSIYNYNISSTNSEEVKMHKDLALLLSTSGSTGSPKLVRHSFKNIETNAKNVAKVFDIKPDHKPILFLPLQYTMGLSVLTSHLFGGATIYLTDLGLTDKNFWSYLETSKITNFTGVPFSFDILNKLRFFKKNKYHSLKIISQGGGKLNENLYKIIADFCHENQIKFIPTYGQTEGTARMSFLSSEKVLNKICSIGNAIPEGKIDIVDENKNIISETDKAGEMVYKGPNVTMGYAETKNDLIKDDEFKGELYTGDIAYFDQERDLFIVGRKKRFLKIYGLRISLDVVEQSIKNNFDTDVYCYGDDSCLQVIITNNDLIEKIRNHTLNFTNLFHKAVKVSSVKQIPRNNTGKVNFNVGI